MAKKFKHSRIINRLSSIDQLFFIFDEEYNEGQSMYTGKINGVEARVKFYTSKPVQICAHTAEDLRLIYKTSIDRLLNPIAERLGHSGERLLDDSY